MGAVNDLVVLILMNFISAHGKLSQHVVFILLLMCFPKCSQLLHKMLLLVNNNYILGYTVINNISNLASCYVFKAMHLVGLKTSCWEGKDMKLKMNHSSEFTQHRNLSLQIRGEQHNKGWQKLALMHKLQIVGFYSLNLAFIWWS